jgi:outer membrane protein TolC
MPQSLGPMKALRILFVLAGAIVTAAAQTNAPEARSMSLEDCLEIALRHNLDVQIQRINPDIAHFSLKGTYGAYDPSLTAGGEHSYSLSPGGVDDQGRFYAGTESKSDNLRGALSGLLPWGTTYSLGASLTDTYGTRPGATTDFSQPSVITNSFVDINTGRTISSLITNYPTVAVRTPFESTSGSVGFMNLQQPLLRNFLIDGTRLQIALDKRNLKISELELRNQVITTVTEVEQAYYNLIFAQENVRVQQKALELAERLLAENRKRVEVGALAPLDEKQAEAQAAGSRADLLSAEGTADTQQRVLKALLSDDYSKWKDVAIRPTVALVAVPQGFNLQESWRNGLTRRPDVLQQRLNIEKQAYVVRYQKNQLLPQVDAVGSYGYNAGSTPEFSGAIDQWGNRDNPFWSVGAQMSIPLPQTSARYGYRTAKATAEQAALQLRQLEQTVMIRIENAIAVARTSFQRASATREARIYAEDALEAEQKKLESGKSTSFEVLRLQRDLTTASSAEIRALADYNIALAQIALNEGTTLERRRIDLEYKYGIYPGGY